MPNCTNKTKRLKYQLLETENLLFDLAKVREQESKVSQIPLSQKAKVGRVHDARKQGSFRELRRKTMFLQSQTPFCATRLLGVNG